MDGVSPDNCDCKDATKHTGLYLYYTGADGKGTCTIPSLYEKYDVLKNTDWRLDGNGVMMPNDWTISDETFIDFTPSQENESGSFVWNFTYDCINATDEVNIYPRAGKDAGGDSATLFNFNDLSTKFTAGSAYEIELGVLKLKQEAGYYVYVNVDGVLAYENTITTGIENGHGLLFDTTGTAAKNGAGVCSYDDGYGVYEYFDVLYNSDWTINNAQYPADQGPMGSSWTMTGHKNLMFEPTAQNTTGSFIWKYQYTHDAYTSGNLAVFPFSTRLWTGVNEYMTFEKFGFEVGKTYDVEFGVLKRKGSADNAYEIFVKADGEYVYGPTAWTRYCRDACNCGDPSKHIGLHVYFLTNGSGTCTQTYNMYSVTVDGKKYEAAPGAVLGSALVTYKDAPAGYTYTGAWQDQNGNPVTKDTVVNSNLVVTPVLEEVIEYEYYDELTNDDWTVNGSPMPNPWTEMSNGKFLNFTPSAENTTGSFVWKYTYTHTEEASGSMLIYPFASKAWGNTRYFDYKECDFAVGQTYDVEFGVVKIKNKGYYHVFVKVNGTLIVDQKDWTRTCPDNVDGVNPDNCDCKDAMKHTGLYLYYTGADGKGTCTIPSPYEKYDVLTNADWKFDGNGITMPNDWTIANGTYIDFEPSEENTTGSFVWKFDYKCIDATGAVNIYPRAGGEWGGHGETVFDFNNLAHKFTADDTYEVELGVQKLKKQEAYYVSVKVDGELWYEKTITAGIENGSGLYFYTMDEAARKGAGVCSYDDGYDAYEYFDVLHNSDWTEYNGSNVLQGTMGEEWTMSNNKFITFTPSAENETGSFIWKYQYTHTKTDSGQMLIYPFANGAWGGSSNAMFDYKNCGFTEGQTYDVEFGVLKYKDSSSYHVFVKAGDKILHESKTFSRPDTCSGDNCTCAQRHIGLYLYYTNDNGSGTCTQTAYNVNVDGKMYEVASNKTLGSALAAFNGPRGYTLAGWKDQNGADFAKITPITSNMTVTPIYTYDYTVVDESGATLTNGTHTYGSAVAYDASGLTTGLQTLLGYTVGDGLYKDLTASVVASAEAGSSVVAETITLGSVAGASVRLGSKMSIRFTSTINKADSADALIKSFGMVIAADDARRQLSDFTIENLNAAGVTYRTVQSNQNGFKYGLQDEYPDQYFYSVVFDTLSVANSGTDYAVRAYVQVEYADGTTGYVYSEFDPNENVRSMYEVACAAIQDTGAGYSNNDKTSMQKYIDAVVDLNSSLALQGPSRNYTVTVSDPTDGYYTITVNPSNGFDIKNLGCVLVNGQRMKIYNANLSEKTFQIKEGDTAEAAAGAVFAALDGVEADRDLLINAYSGPQLGVKLDSGNKYYDSGHTVTLADLELYMAAGFNAWRVEAGVETDVLSGNADGTIYAYTGSIFSSKDTYDIYEALDVAAQYAAKYNKPCPVYINITNLTDRNVTAEGLEAIKDCYLIFTNYDDGITGQNGVPGTVAGKKNQIAGFILKDEPTWAEYDNFATAYNHIAYTLGAIDAGYDFQVALLQTYAGSSLLGGTYEAYVARYATLLEDTTIAFDNYPYNYQYKEAFWGSSTTRTFGTDWFSDMETVRAQSNGYGTCIQSYTAGPSTTGSIQTTTKYKEITQESQISMQVYTALAYGFTNFDYFTYTDRLDYDLQVKAEVFQEVPVQWNNYADWSQGYTTTSMYGWIQNTNAEATKLYDVLGKFTSQGVQLVKGSTTANIFGSAKTTNTTNAITTTSTYDMVVGGFKCGELNGYLAVNVDYQSNDGGGRTTSATFTLGTGYTKALVYVDGVATLKTLTNGKLTMNVGAGEGVFIVPFN